MSITTLADATGIMAPASIYADGSEGEQAICRAYCKQESGRCSGTLNDQGTKRMTSIFRKTGADWVCAIKGTKSDLTSGRPRLPNLCLIRCATLRRVNRCLSLHRCLAMTLSSIPL